MKKVLVSRGDFNDKVSFAKDLLKDEKECLMITGMAGSGKTEFAKRLSAKGVDVIHLDDFAEKKENQWIINVKDIPFRSRVFEGISDNFAEVMKKIKPTTVFMIVASPGELKTAYADRANDRLNQFQDYFKAKSELSDSAIAFEQKQFINGRI